MVKKQTANTPKSNPLSTSSISVLRSGCSMSCGGVLSWVGAGAGGVGAGVKGWEIYSS